MKLIHILVVVLCCIAAASRSGAAELERLDGAVLVKSRGNDGDSFRISHGGKELTIRLYYVDCPEVNASSKADAARVREQTRHFGLEGHDRTVHFGREAAAFVQRRLNRPFTVHTAYAMAMGRSRGGRSYAFVTTASGEDLAYLLVKNGYARVHGVARMLPNGTPSKTAAVRLSDLELAAVLDHRGIWAEAESDRLVELRAVARTEAEALAQVEREVTGVFSSVNVNTASAEVLEGIDGIGPIFALRLIQHRPYKTAEDLDRVPGISGKRLTHLLEQITFD